MSEMIFYYQSKEESMIAKLVDGEYILTKYDRKCVPLIGTIDAETFYSCISSKTMPTLLNTDYTEAEGSFVFSAAMLHRRLRDVIAEKNIWIKIPLAEEKHEK